MSSAKSFDYVVIGAGASGSVVAGRISANSDASVLILEAGPMDTSSDFHTLPDFVKLWGSDVDWKFMTEAQSGLNGRQLMINQGKVMGGGSSINAMMHVRGNARNYDYWNYLGNDGWSYADVLPYFKKMEDYEGGESDVHGVGGPLSVRQAPDAAARSEPFMNALVELGFDGPYWDVNSDRQEHGAGLLHFNITKDGMRASASDAYLVPNKDRSNLTIEVNAEVTKIIIEGGRAVGVEYLQNGQTVTARATSEVIVSGGAFLSPKLLMLSGIGPAAHLKSLGIDVVADLPGVGQNLQDHMQLPVVYRSKVDHPHPTLLTANVMFWRSRPGMSAGAPDMQLNFIPAIPAPLLPVMPNFGFPVCIFLPILVQPQSVGEVLLRSANPLDPPVLNPNYLSVDTDVEVFRRTVELIRSLTATKAFSGINDGEIAPGGADLDEYIRTSSSTLWHPAGTCKMGRDAMAVVDPELNVYGVAGLRVVDASVMPAVTSGNTHAPALMIGEKAVDLILG